MKMVKPCWKPIVEGDGLSRVGDSCRRGGDPNGKFDGLLWYKDLGPHVNGEFSMAVVQANSLLEDQSQLESGPLSSLDSGPYGTFIGVYDGHGGPETSRFLNENLFPNLKKFASEHQEISATVIKKAFLATEEDFLYVVREQWLTKPQIASVGSCCLVGVICNGLLYVANVGDSRVVLGRAENAVRGVTAIQLSTEHNASIESVRDELRSLHPHDSQIVVLRHKVWRVKGLIQVSRSIGDAYLKKSEFNKEPLLAKFRLPEPFHKPILSPEPSICIHKLNPKDQFLIFASDGLWEHLSNQEAVDIVHSYPRNGIAKRLIKAALRVAAKKREMRYSDLKKIDRGVRRHFHDDITVVVVFLDPPLMNRSSSRSSTFSLRGGGGVPTPAKVSEGKSKLTASWTEEHLHHQKSHAVAHRINEEKHIQKSKLESRYGDNTTGDRKLLVNAVLPGIAKRLIKAALRVAAKKREMRYSDLKKIDRGVRRHFHDDITVVVVFLDPPLMNRSSSRSSTFSLRGGGGVPTPAKGIAKRLIKAALRVAAKKREMRYSDLKKIDRGVRRHFHDDITVVVVFLDPPLMNRSSSRSSTFSLRGGGGVPTPAKVSEGKSKLTASWTEEHLHHQKSHAVAHRINEEKHIQQSKLESRYGDNTTGDRKLLVNAVLPVFFDIIPTDSQTQNYPTAT
ncbi:unnamed protein product [Ilex paraguariensis]|uniref:protein-serine/threonine phosphatase n=1 Tax=Ilex paraguariensis TaxID=185542 RepID=A0ABC8TD03_9AQUA